MDNDTQIMIGSMNMMDYDENSITFIVTILLYILYKFTFMTKYQWS